MEGSTLLVWTQRWHNHTTVDIVMLEKINCILSKRATKPIYMRVRVPLNAISRYQSQQLSPAIQDITLCGHTRHLRLQLYMTSPSLAIQDISAQAIQDISAPAIRDSSPAETSICNTPPSCYASWSKKNKHQTKK